MNDKDYLKKVIDMAAKSTEPVGCASILVDSSGKLIAQEVNSQRADKRTASHAEMKVITKANKLLGRKLKGVTAYGNCEPCTMCLTALVFAGVDRVVFANRLNDLVTNDRKIDIDCFEFVQRFPYQPKLEHIEIQSTRKSELNQR